jgi:integrase
MKLIKRGKRALTRDRPPTIEELKLMLSHADLKGKALFLTLVSSGMRIGEATKLYVNDIDFEHVPTKIYLRGNITKTGEPRITFISDEVALYMREWLRQRESYLKLAVKRTNIPNVRKSIDDNRIFPFTPNAARLMFIRLLRLTNLDMKDDITDRYVIHIHALRKFFRSQLALSCPTEIVETLMGHEGYLSGSYRRYSESELASYYKKAMDRVTIFEHKNREELEHLDKENRRLHHKLDDIDDRVKHFERIEELTDVLKNLKLKPDLSKALAYK